MKRYLIIGTGLLMLAGTGAAVAQMPPPGGPDGPRGPMNMNMNPHERWMMDHYMHRDRGRGTSFRFRKGDASVDINCSSRDPLQECVAAASALLDKLNSVNTKPATSQ